MRNELFDIPDQSNPCCEVCAERDIYIEGGKVRDRWLCTPHEEAMYEAEDAAGLSAEGAL